MSDSVSPNRLTKRQEQAAALVAADTEADERIAARCGVTGRTLWRWKNVPLFAARVAELRDAYAAAVCDLGISDKRNRVEALQTLHDRAMLVIEQRAADPSLAEVPGGTTGLLVRQQRTVAGEAVDEYVVDTGLMREVRETMKQAAQELGQWVNKVAPTDADGRALDWAALLALARQGGADGGDG